MEDLRKYVAYSKRITPVMTEEAARIIENSYLNIRKMGEGENKSVPITARQLEAYVRLSEASARMRLSRKVTEEDADRAVHLIEYYLGKIAAPHGDVWDIDAMTTGITKRDRDSARVLKEIIGAYGDEGGVSMEELIAHAASEGIAEDAVRKTMKKILEAGDVYEPSPGRYKRA